MAPPAEGGAREREREPEAPESPPISVSTLERIIDVAEVQLAPPGQASQQGTLDIFTGATHAGTRFGPRMYGGQLIGQALVAASRTVAGGRTCHSLHAYFLAPGDPSQRLVFTVERLKDGRSFSSRHVVARQRGGAVFTMQASYQLTSQWESADAPRHQRPMPQGVPPPESLPTQEQRRDSLIRRVPEQAKRDKLREKFAALPPFPIDVRFVDQNEDTSRGPYAGGLRRPREPRQLAWIRAPEAVAEHTGTPEAAQEIHKCVVAYASDWALLQTAALPFDLPWPKVRLNVASLDHAIWFHAPFRADEWLLYEMESDSAAGERGLAAGRLYNQQGTLVASVSQEGLLRVVPAKPSAKL